MNRDEIVDLFKSKPRHAGRILSSFSDLNNFSGNTIAEKAYNYCYPNSSEKYQYCLTCKVLFDNFISFNQGYRAYCSPKCAMNNEQIKSARESTCLAKYGVKNPLAYKETRERLKASSLEKYGTITPIASQIVKEKVKKTILERYGVDHAFKALDVQLKAKESQRRYYIEEQWPERINIIEKERKVELLNDKTYKGEGFEYSWKHECGTIFQSKVLSGYILSCPRCKETFSSKGEQELLKFIEQFTNVESRVRNVVHPYELDVYCPDKKLAFEYNGDYFHSSEIKTPTYHLDKLSKCENSGIKLINIFEHEWKHKRNIIESRIRSIFGVNQRIYARKCIIKLIDSSRAWLFLQDNHLYGSVKSKHNLGLIYNGELVALMSFGKPRFNKKYQWELLRYCSKLNVNVIGGASKLLKAFNQTSIITYADRCWSNGNLYQQLGFEEIIKTPPSYFYLKGDNRISRYQAQKHMLPSLLGDQFDNGLTEIENMKKAKYIQIYDCGNIAFHLKV